MSDLQATIEFVVELYKFYNVDLFQRGLYQVRCALRVTPRMPVQVETCMPEPTTQQQQHQTQSTPTNSSGSLLADSVAEINHPPGTGASRVFQILYRNEEVTLKDVILFRAHLLVDSRHLKESIERAEFSLSLELWFGDQAGSGLTLASTRVLQLNFHPCRGLHYHLPVLFDYFHLAAVTLGIHASLVALHQPYINAPKSTRTWIGGGKLNCRGTISPGPLEAVFFGQAPTNTMRCTGNSNLTSTAARHLHKEICSMLLEALESLKVSLSEFTTVLPQQWVALMGNGVTTTNGEWFGQEQRLKKITEAALLLETEDEFTARANSDIAQLCAECIFYWRKIVSASGQASVHSLLAKKHQILRVRRFAEGFFVTHHLKHVISNANNDTQYSQYAGIAEMTRKSKYMAALPPLPVHCTALDGDVLTMPFIFEDLYQERSCSMLQNNGDFNNDLIISTAGLEPASTKPKLLNELRGVSKGGGIGCAPASAVCSCGIISSASVDRFWSSHNTMGILTPKLALGGQILQASLSIAPAAHHHSIHYRAGTRYSMINFADQENNNGKCHHHANKHGNCQQQSAHQHQLGNNVQSHNNNFFNGGGTELLIDGSLRRERETIVPSFGFGQSGTRHSRSLDQLECQFADTQSHPQQQLQLERRVQQYSNYIMPPAPPQPFNADLIVRSLPRKSTTITTPMRVTAGQDDTKLIRELRKDETEDLLRNINEFREKYKNAAAGEMQHQRNLSNGCLVVAGKSMEGGNTIKSGGAAKAGAEVAAEDDESDLEPRPFQRRKYAPRKYFNSLPKGSSVAKLGQNGKGAAAIGAKFNLQVTRQIQDASVAACPLLAGERGKKNVENQQLNCNTIPRCHSTNVLKNKPRRHRRSRSGGEKIKYNSHSRLQGGRGGKISDNGVAAASRSGSSSSSECTATSGGGRRRKERSAGGGGLLASHSVPFKLEDLEKSSATTTVYRRAAKTRISYKNSESLPNLAPPPPGFESSSPFFLPRLHKEPSSSTSSLSDQSGFVSSRRSSNGGGGKERLVNGKIGREPESSPDCRRSDGRTLNGRQLRTRLQHLLREQPERKKNQECLQVRRTSVTVRLPPKKVAINNQKHSMSTELLAKEVIKNGSGDKSKSEVDLSNLADDCTSNFENLQLPPPPQQFSDAPPPLPPDQFRDPPTTIDDILNNIPIPDLATRPGTLTAQIHKLKLIPKPKISSPEVEDEEPPLQNNAIDNPLYHQVIYQQQPPAKRFVKPPFLKSQSSNDLLSNAKIRDLIENSKRQDGRGDFKRKDMIDSLQPPMPPPPPPQQMLEFEKGREEFQTQIKFKGTFYSDHPKLASSELPYFHISDEYRPFSPAGLHLIICVHGLDGNSADLRLVRMYLELGLPGAHLEFLMSERNQGDTFSDFETMTDRLVAEILCHIELCGLNPTKISFVAHSLGTIIVRSALSRPQMRPLLNRLHTFFSLSGPHLGTLYNNSGLVNMGLWFMQKWKKSGSLQQLCFRDSADLRQCFLYRLSQRSTLHHFKHILLCGSSQDRYVPAHSARLELCKSALKDSSTLGTVYREMVQNILAPVMNNPEATLARYDIHHALPNTANTLIGRAAHIAVLDSELFIEKFLLVAGLKYFS